jgi:redox-sensitive bicupin YhaK (pirin superfamily)
VVHSEMPTEEVLEKGGVMEGFQLWVNLPAKDKMIKPRYQVGTRAMYACVCVRAHVH